MIKGITFLRPVDSPSHFDDLVSFFSALGFEAGRGWDDPPGADSVASGRPFLAPLGNLEFVTGKLPVIGSDLLVEVTALDDLHRVAGQWLADHPGTSPIGNIEATHWSSRLFTVEPVPGFTVAFWESEHPQRGKPIALEGDLSAAGLRFLINAVITDRLLQGALDALVRSGAARDQIRVVRVPGSWEIPAAARTLAQSGDFDAIIALGCLIRGETAHYEAIYNEVARGIGQSQQDTGVPHSFGVLTCETLEQALDRAGLKSGNKGFEAAVAAIEMASLYSKLAGRIA